MKLFAVTYLVGWLALSLVITWVFHLGRVYAYPFCGVLMIIGIWWLRRMLKEES